MQEQKKNDTDPTNESCTKLKKCVEDIIGLLLVLQIVYI